MWKGNFLHSSFNSRPELIIESYERYIPISEPTSARNSNEESPVATVDEILTHCSLSLVWYETAMMESKVVYRLQKYSWKDHLTTGQEIQWKISRSNGMSEKVFLFFRSCFFSSKSPLFSPPFLGKWNWFVRKWWTRFRDEMYYPWILLTICMPKPPTEWFVHKNGKHPKTRIGRRQT